MKLCIIALFAALLALAVSPGGAATTAAPGGIAGAMPVPTPITPVAVPGTTLHHNEATTKPGYSFVKNGKAVNVISDRHYNIVGNYVCVNSADGSAAPGCYNQSTPRNITCKGSVSGSGNYCILTAGPPPMLRAN